MKHQLPIDKSIVLREYNASLDMCARLGAYASARFLEFTGDGDYLQKADELAHRDLLLLAISMRRLAELTSTRDLLQGKYFREGPYFSPDDKSGFASRFKAEINCWDILNKVIHGRDFFAFKTDHDVRKLAIKSDAEIESWYRSYQVRKDIPAMFAVKSDRGTMELFTTAALIAKCVEYLDEAKELLLEEGILEEF